MEKYVFALVLFILSANATSAGEVGVVVKTYRACDLFIVEAPSGFHVLEWWHGPQPALENQIAGELNRYDTTKVTLLGQDSEVDITVEHHAQSREEALLVASDLCIIDDC